MRASLRTNALLASVLVVFLAGCSSNPAETKAEAVRQGDASMEQKKYGDAVRAYQAAVAVDPEDGQLRLKLARALQGNQSWDLAARQFITAAEKLPNDWDAQLEGINWMLGLSRFFDAGERISALLQQKRDDPRLLMLLGVAKAEFRYPEMGVYEVEAQMRQGRSFEYAKYKLVPDPLTKPQDAERRLRQAYSLAPDEHHTRLALAGYLWLYGDVDEGGALLKLTADKERDNIQANRAVGFYFDYRDKPAEAEQYLKVAADSRDKDSEIALADFYIRRKRFPEALAILDPIAEKNDPDFTAAARAANAELLLGRNADALKRADGLLAKKPFDAVALRVKSKVLLASGDKAQALELAKGAVAGAPTSRDAHLALAEALAATGDVSKAFEEYSEVWRADMKDAHVARTLAAIALTLGRDGVAEDLAGQSLRLNPTDAEAAIIAARANVRLGNFAAADRVLKPFAAGKSASASMLALEGSILAARGSVEPARASFRKALQIDRNSIEALTGLVDVEIKAGKASAVRVQVDQAASAHAGHPSYLLLVARIAVAEGDAKRAETALRTILAQDAAREDAVLLFSSLVSKQGRLAEARAALERTLERAPSSVPVRLALGELLERQGLWTEARAQYDRIITDNQLAGGTTAMLDAFHTASARIAALSANRGTNLDEALQMAMNAKRYRPDDPFFSDTLGWVHIKKQRARLGLPHLEAALKADPRNPAIHYHLGVAYDQMGELGKARQSLTEALRLGSTFPGSDDARNLLKVIGK